MQSFLDDVRDAEAAVLVLVAKPDQEILVDALVAGAALPTRSASFACLHPLRQQLHVALHRVYLGRDLDLHVLLLVRKQDLVVRFSFGKLFVEGLDLVILRMLSACHALQLVVQSLMSLVQVENLVHHLPPSHRQEVAVLIEFESAASADP